MRLNALIPAACARQPIDCKSVFTLELFCTDCARTGCGTTILICLYIPTRLMCTPHPFNIPLSISCTADNLKYLKPLKTTPTRTFRVVSKQ